LIDLDSLRIYLWKLVLVNRAARMGCNPATGQAITVKAKRVVKVCVANDAILGTKKHRHSLLRGALFISECLLSCSIKFPRSNPVSQVTIFR
jgi:hypothetical protein